MNNNYPTAETKNVDLTNLGDGYILIVKSKGSIALYDTFTFEIINVVKNYYYKYPKTELVYKEYIQDIYTKASKIINNHKS